MTLVESAKPQRKIPLIRGLEAQQRIQRMLGCSQQKAVDILESWIRRGRLRAYVANALYDYDDDDRSEEVPKYIFEFCLDTYLTENDLKPESKEGINFDKIRVRENQVMSLLAEAIGRTAQGEINFCTRINNGEDAEHSELEESAAQEVVPSNGRRFKQAAYEVQTKIGLPLQVAEDALIGAVNHGKVRAWLNLPARYEQFSPDWPLRQPVDPETHIDGDQLAAWLEAEHSPDPAPALKGVWALVYPAAIKWLKEEGVPFERGDQAKLENFIMEEVQRRGETISESTARRHSKAVVERFKAQTGS
jgi:hypothetical protein